MIDKKLKTVKELLDFVLTECGGMKYSHFTKTDYSYSHLALTFRENLIFDYVIYAEKLLQEKFGENILVLKLDYLDLIDIPDNFLISFEKLKGLECEGNNLKSLPKLPNSLIRLNCSDNNLTELPELPENLQELVCINNNLNFLPDLSNLKKLSFLSFGRNNIWSLPKLSDSIREIHCAENPGYKINFDGYVR